MRLDWVFLCTVLDSGRVSLLQQDTEASAVVDAGRRQLWSDAADPSAIDLYDSEVASSSSSLTGSYVRNTLSSESITSRPSGCDQPWPYCFYNATEPIAPQSGQLVWAKGGNNRWRRVLLLDDGTIEDHDSYCFKGNDIPIYTATWTNDGHVIRGTFSPLLGDLKPDTDTIRRLLRDEKVPIQGEQDLVYLESVDSG
ncbi:hypothetical protein PAXINDRAFT_155358 [Paxillus involutus ATCC 200175]|uniref:Uncharacterized protein n=1 Tax=Paxillus involutus ATCC 200175 TaxID=664439 RepID=A0A0C9U8Q4_PAXIN|nr:hypothetical protein PAXINDRAFT_155358 [Paxillus involutus ATCC 200175]